jgi:hypothetical protein
LVAVTFRKRVIPHPRQQNPRLRLKQKEITKLPTTKKERNQYEKQSLLINGKSRMEMLTRNGNVLFKRRQYWAALQQKRATLLFLLATKC